MKQKLSYVRNVMSINITTIYRLCYFNRSELLNLVEDANQTHKQSIFVRLYELSLKIEKVNFSRFEFIFERKIDSDLFKGESLFSLIQKGIDITDQHIEELRILDVADTLERNKPKGLNKIRSVGDINNEFGIS